jgi:sulfur carrier protein
VVQAPACAALLLVGRPTTHVSGIGQDQKRPLVYEEMSSPTSATNTISVNGEMRPLTRGATVLDLLRELGLDSGRVAIERNLEILPRPKWTETRIEPGDRYEIVQFVGGG